MNGENGLRAFQPGKIGNVVIKNRLVRSATFEQMATEKGEVTDELVEFYRRLGSGGIGLIITSHTAVHPQGYSNPKQMRIVDDSYISGLRRLSDTVHELGNNCKIFLQITHAGRQQIRPELAHLAVAPSAVFDELFQRTPRELTLEEIDHIIDCFAEGIERAAKAGFDGAQLHAGHGWLLSSFLSLHTNRREDAFGGSTLNRTRIFSEIYRRGRGKVGEEFPILVKMNTDDYVPEGMDLSEAKKVAGILSEIGFAAVETSGGMWEALIRDEKDLGWKPLPIPEARVRIKPGRNEAYFWENAKEFRKSVDIPLILVGGIRSLEMIESILREGSIDFCSMSRPLIQEPDLPNKWLSGKRKGPAKCISCNACLPRPGRGVECRVEEKAGIETVPLSEMYPYFRDKAKI
jgi:2,4-dienoyl-CoA reductase-like NADH-dependent reductase (Old Yellow Enzyme family)